MKSIANQYCDLKEGRLSQANFMRNLRMVMPQYITNVTSFKDAVKILKNKSIINENLKELGPAAQQMAGNPEEEAEYRSSLIKKKKAGDDEDEQEILAMLDKIEQEKSGEEAVMGQYDPMDEEQLNEYGWDYVRGSDGNCYKVNDEGVRIKVNDAYCGYNESLSEGRKKKEAKTELHPNQIHPQELRMGIKVELEHTDDLDKAKKIALDHLAENPFYYTALKLSGIESPSAPKVKAPKEASKKAKKKDATELVDKANQMQKIKMPKVVKEGLDEDHAFDRESQIAFIEKSGHYNGDLDNKSDEEIKKIYDTVEKISKQQKPKFGKIGDIDMGSVKEQLRAIVREVIDEYYYDGRDNLTKITDDTK